MATAKSASPGKAPAQNNKLTVVETVSSTYQNAARNLSRYGSNAGRFGSIAGETAQLTFKGFIRFERAFANCLRANLDNTVEHGRNILKAPSVADVAVQHTAFLNDQIELIGSQIKDLSDVAEQQSKEALAPLFGYVDETVAKAREKSA